MRTDPRVTRIGAVLRRYSLDELPQVFNVLTGSMSLVGPRPPLPREVEAYADDARRRLLVRPGMTGLWQVSGRSEISWEERVSFDYRQVRHWSLHSDMRVLADTLGAVLHRRGAE
jgi:lipopolysaccharide/colanic/teichoic acid biosynthesis glycosyltransferase